MEKGNANFHFLDRYVGIPLVFFLGLFRLVKRRIPSGFVPRRVAILNISSIGDNVLMSGPLADLKSSFPGCEIHIFCGDTNHGVVKLIGGVSSVTKLPLTNVRQSISLIRNQPAFDLMVDFGPWPRLNSIYAAFFKAKYKIGFRSAGQQRHYVYDYAVHHSDQRHEVDNFRALLSPLQIVTGRSPLLQVPEPTVLPAGPYILFHPWPGGYKSFMKEWPRNNWLNLADKMADLGYKMYITGAPVDKSASDRMAYDSYGTLTSIAGRHSLAEISGIIKNASLLVTVNTGIMHIGAALGIPMVALNGPTSVKRWGPVSENALSIAPAGGDCGYLHYGYEYHLSKANCMELITVSEVFDKVRQKLPKI